MTLTQLNALRSEITATTVRMEILYDDWGRATGVEECTTRHKLYIAARDYRANLLRLEMDEYVRRGQKWVVEEFEEGKEVGDGTGTPKQT